MLYFYSIATAQDKKDIETLLLTHYLHDEALNAAADIQKEDYVPIMKPTVQRCLETPFSFIARHTETGELAGVSLSSVWERGEEEEEYYATKTRTDAAALAQDEITNILHNSFWQLVDSDVQFVLHREMSCVAKHHRRNGIASHLLKMSMEILPLKMYNVDGIVSEASSSANQRLLGKHGFRVLNALNYCDYRDENGDFLLVPKDGSTKIELLWKSIKEIEDNCNET